MSITETAIVLIVSSNWSAHLQQTSDSCKNSQISALYINCRTRKTIETLAEMVKHTMKTVDFVVLKCWFEKGQPPQHRRTGKERQGK